MPLVRTTRSATMVWAKASSRSGLNGTTTPAAPTSAGVASTAWWATVTRKTPADRVTSSSSEPPHWTRVMAQSPAPSRMDLQLATNGSSSRAATWATTSLPRSVPQASTAVAPVARTSWATVSPQASGPKSVSSPWEARWTVEAPWAPRSAAARSAPFPITTAAISIPAVAARGRPKVRASSEASVMVPRSWSQTTSRLMRATPVPRAGRPQPERPPGRCRGLPSR